MKRIREIRPSEWIYLGYFAYTAVLALILSLPGGAGWRSAAMFACVLAAVLVLQARPLAILRDWMPLGFTLLAYREMDWFTPAYKDRHLERSWVAWDERILHEWGLQRIIESLGPLLPGYLELCYMLVYVVGFYCIGVLYAERRRDRVDQFLCVYGLGALLSYALFPFFPSDPPRLVFGWIDMPNVVTPLRTFNLYLVNGYGIHSSVFPSAHVSSGFAAAWGLRHTLPEKPWFGRATLIYATSMSIATVYGRYHYAVDALAGAAVGLAAIGLVKAFRLARGTA